MTRMTYKPGNKRSALIRRLSYEIMISWEKTNEFIKKHELSGNASVDVENILKSSDFIDEYTYNADWISSRQIYDICYAAIQSIVSHARFTKNAKLEEWAINYLYNYGRANR